MRSISAREHVFESLKSARTEFLALVAPLSDAQLKRTGVHPVFGALTVPHWIEFFLFHEAYHVYMVMSLAATAIGRSNAPSFPRMRTAR
jgi:hypothetical protein